MEIKLHEQEYNGNCDFTKSDAIVCTRGFKSELDELCPAIMLKSIQMVNARYKKKADSFQVFEVLKDNTHVKYYMIMDYTELPNGKLGDVITFLLPEDY